VSAITLAHDHVMVQRLAERTPDSPAEIRSLDELVRAVWDLDAPRGPG
jgi:hypothetical protein